MGARGSSGARGRGTRALACGLVLAALAAGCDSRVRQCNALIDAMNAEQDGVVRVLDRVGSRPEVAALEALARAFDNSVQRVSAVALEDAGLRARAVTMQGVLRRFASVVGAMSLAARNNDAAEYNTLRADLDRLNSELAASVDAVNGYCGR